MPQRKSDERIGLDLTADQRRLLLDDAMFLDESFVLTIRQTRPDVSVQFTVDELEQLADELGTDSTKPLHDSLSEREYQIMRLIAAGKRISEIAKELSLSTSAVNTYRTRVLEKMKMERNAELTRYAIENHLID